MFGCTLRRDLELLQDALYELDTIYVDCDLEEIQALLGILEHDYDDCILLESLISYKQKVLYIFENPSNYLIEKIQLLNNYNYQINNYIIYMNIYDLELITLINTYLNKNK